jgi:PTH1 family peptidyl-tRNA hydrolase
MSPWPFKANKQPAGRNSGQPVWLVAGLGNPGAKYDGTRHNAGFLAADELARRAGVRFANAHGMRAQTAETRLGPNGFGPGVDTVKVVIAKPQTFMNDSGIAVGKLAKFFDVPPERVIVIHDELDLPVGHLRTKIGGGDNGHNGLKSVRAHLNTGDFLRVRVGIDRPLGRQQMIDYVLGTFPKNQRADIEVATNLAADAVESLIINGLDQTQNRFNR